MHLNRLFIPVVLSVLSVNAIGKSLPPAKTNTSKTTTPKKPSKSAEKPAAKKPSGTPSTSKDQPIKPSEFDPNIKPSADFFDHVNDKWVKEHPIPSDKSQYGMFDKLDEQ